MTRIDAAKSPLMLSFAAMAMYAHTAPGQSGGHAVAQRRLAVSSRIGVDVVAALGTEGRGGEDRRAHRGWREVDARRQVLGPRADAQAPVVHRLERERGDDAQRACARRRPRRA